MTRRGEALVLVIAIVLAALLGFLIRTPLDRAIERGDYPQLTNIEGMP